MTDPAKTDNREYAIIALAAASIQRTKPRDFFLFFLPDAIFLQFVHHDSSKLARMAAIGYFQCRP
jgi:hypothetical protein